MILKKIFLFLIPFLVQAGYEEEILQKVISILSKEDSCSPQSLENLIVSRRAEDLFEKAIQTEESADFGTLSSFLEPLSLNEWGPPFKAGDWLLDHRKELEKLMIKRILEKPRDELSQKSLKDFNPLLGSVFQTSPAQGWEGALKILQKKGIVIGRWAWAAPLNQAVASLHGVCEWDGYKKAYLELCQNLPHTCEALETIRKQWVDQYRKKKGEIRIHQKIFHLMMNREAVDRGMLAQLGELGFNYHPLQLERATFHWLDHFSPSFARFCQSNNTPWVKEHLRSNYWRRGGTTAKWESFNAKSTLDLKEFQADKIREKPKFKERYVAKCLNMLREAYEKVLDDDVLHCKEFLKAIEPSEKACAPLK